MKPNRPAPLSAAHRTSSSAIHPNAILHLQLDGENLVNVATGFFTNRVSSPLYQICSYALDLRGQQQWKPVLTSPRMSQTLNPSWPMLQVTCHELCRCDLDRPILVRVFDKPQEESPQDSTTSCLVDSLTSMGSFETTVRELLKRQCGKFTLHFCDDEHKPVGQLVVVMVLLEIPTSNKYTSKSNCIKNTGLLGAEQEEEEEEEFSDIDHSLKAAKILVTEINVFSKDTNDIVGDEDQSFSSSGHNSRDSAADGNEQEIKQTVQLTLRAMDLAPLPGGRTVDTDGNPDTSRRYLKVSTLCPGNNSLFQDVFISEPIANDLNPTWGPLEVCLDDLTPNNDAAGKDNSNLDWPILLSVWEETFLVTSTTTTKSASTKRRGIPMGSCQTTVAELLKNQTGKGASDASNTKVAMTLEQRGRVWGKLVCVEASILSTSTEPSVVPEASSLKTADVAPNWLSQTRDLLAELVEYANTGHDATTSNSSKHDLSQTVAYNSRGGCNNQEVRESSLHADDEIFAPVDVDDEVDEESIDDSENDDESDSDGDDGDDITIADIISVAESSILSGKICGRAEKEGMLEIIDILKQKHPSSAYHYSRNTRSNHLHLPHKASATSKKKEPDEKVREKDVPHHPTPEGGNDDDDQEGFIQKETRSPKTFEDNTLSPSHEVGEYCKEMEDSKSLKGKKDKKTNTSKKGTRMNAKHLKAKRFNRILRSIHHTITESLEKITESSPVEKYKADSPESGVSKSAVSEQGRRHKGLPKTTKSLDDAPGLIHPRRSRRPRNLSECSGNEKKTRSLSADAPRQHQGTRPAKRSPQKMPTSPSPGSAERRVNDTDNLDQSFPTLKSHYKNDFDIDTRKAPRKKRQSLTPVNNSITGPFVVSLSDQPDQNDPPRNKASTTSRSHPKNQGDKHNSSTFPTLMPSVYVVKGIGKTVKVGAVGLGKGAKTGAVGLSKGAKVGVAEIGRGAKAVRVTGIVSAVGKNVVAAAAVRENVKFVTNKLSNKKDKKEGFYDKICATESESALLPILGIKSDLDDDDFWAEFDKGTPLNSKRTSKVRTNLRILGSFRRLRQRYNLVGGPRIDTNEMRIICTMETLPAERLIRHICKS